MLFEDFDDIDIFEEFENNKKSLKKVTENGRVKKYHENNKYQQKKSRDDWNKKNRNKYQKQYNLIKKMQLHKTKSSSVAAMGYNPKGKQMQVLFKNDTLYQYEDISLEEFDAIWYSESKGTKLKEIVKGKTYTKL